MFFSLRVVEKKIFGDNPNFGGERKVEYIKIKRKGGQPWD